MRNLRNLLMGAVLMAPEIGLSGAHAQNIDAPYVPKPCSEHVTVAPADVANDPNLDPAVRKFLIPLDKDPSPFWELPQPKPQEVLTGLQNATPVDMSGVTISEQSLTVDGRALKLFVMKPDHVEGH